jgi:protoheme IX farnesyltransferase
MSWAYGIGAVAGGALFLQRCALLIRVPDRRNAMRAFFASLAQLTLLFLGALVDVALFSAPAAR